MAAVLVAAAAAAAAITVGDGAGGDPRRSSPFFYVLFGRRWANTPLTTERFTRMKRKDQQHSLNIILGMVVC